MESPFSQTRSGIGKGTLSERDFAHAKVVMFQGAK